MEALDVEIIEKSSRPYIVNKEMMTIDIDIFNHSPFYLGEIVISPYLKDIFAFIEGSVCIDDVNYRQENIYTGIHLTMLPPGEKCTVSFNVKPKIDEGKGCIRTKAQINYIDNEKKEHIVNIQGKGIQILLYSAEIECIQDIEKQEMSLNDCSLYSIILNNKGNLEMCGILFQVELCECLDLVNESVKINGYSVYGIDLKKGIYIPRLNKGEYYNVEYKVKMVNDQSLNVINRYKFKYKYILPDGSLSECTEREMQYPTRIEMKISAFKRININKDLILDEQDTPMQSIDDVTVNMIESNYYVINTPKGVSKSGQYMSGYKLMIHGKMAIDIEYTTKLNEQCMLKNYIIPVSAFVVLSGTYNTGNKLSIKNRTENVYFRRKSETSLWISADLILEVLNKG